MSEMQFEGQREGEKVKMVFRRHFSTTYRGFLWFFVMVGLGLLPVFMWKTDPRMFWVFLAMFFVGLLGFFYIYALWYFSIFIVTDQRIRQISQKGIFKKAVVDLPFEKIENVAFLTPGIFAGIFGYGVLVIQTSAGEITISKVNQVEKVYNKIQNTIGKKDGE